jgi:F-type H+-transporting ATPase subunit delta
MKGGSTVTSKVYEPYAQALLSLGQSSNSLDALSGDISMIADTMAGSSELTEFLANPFILDDVKKNVIASMFGEQVNPMTLNFLKLLVDRRRAVCLPGICAEFQSLLRKLNQAVLAEVISTVELTDAQKQNISDRVKNMTNAQSVDLKTSIDPDLIGGVIIKVGSQVIDASLRGQLRRISYQLAGVTQ